LSEQNTRLVHQLVTEEVRHAVALAIQDGGIVRTGDVAAAVIGAYPNCGMTAQEIADEVIRAASLVGVAVEMSRPTIVNSANSCELLELEG
jgi:hypothetical protein